MKNLILTAIAFTLSISFIFAQSNDHVLTQEQEAKCTELTRTMVNELRLNELGYIKLKALNRERIALIEAAKENLKNDLAAQEQKFKQIEADFDQKLYAMLNASQLQAYAVYKRKSEVKLIAATEER